MMYPSQKFAVLDDPAQAAGTPSSAVFELEIDLSPKPVHIAIAATDQQATMSDLVPAARQLATIISKAVIDNLLALGRDVPCQKGCDECCRYMISLAPAEAFRLVEEVDNLDEPKRQHMLNRFNELAQKIIASPLPELSAEAIDNWYRPMNLTCPFHRGHICQTYATRPIACREHFVTTPSALCSHVGPGHIEPVSAAPSIAEALVVLAGELEQAPGEAVILPLAIAWAKTYSHRSRRTWPANYLAQRFVAIVQADADKSAHQADMGVYSPNVTQTAKSFASTLAS